MFSFTFLFKHIFQFHYGSEPEDLALLANKRPPIAEKMGDGPSETAVVHSWIPFFATKTLGGPISTGGFSPCEATVFHRVKFTRRHEDKDMFFLHLQMS